MTFNVIPVLDIMHGQAVHAIAGRREAYQPLNTLLAEGSQPLDVARGFRDRLGFSTLYLADLDAISGGAPASRLYEKLIEEGFELLVDAGLVDQSTAKELLERPNLNLVVGLETVRGPDAASAILNFAGSSRVVFSLDLVEGCPRVAAGGDWWNSTPDQIAKRVIELGYKRLILLDLARVGTGRGPSAVGLLGRIKESASSSRILVGGGISGIDDLRLLKCEGASGALVGSALHDGRIGSNELKTFLEEIDP
jgi:phosphoribosylformimino-5-aminoimidazole carboxamide ribotide isomerase